MFVQLNGTGFVVNDDHTVATEVEFLRDGIVHVRKVPYLEGNLDGTSLTVGFKSGEAAPPSEVPPHEFQVRVVNPDDQQATWDGAFIVQSRFGLGGVSPSSGAAGTVVTLAFTGDGFYGPMRATIETRISETADAVVTSPDSATATFDLTGAKPGTYAVTLRSAGGCVETIVSAFTVTN